MTPPPDFKPGGGTNTHDTVLLEWTAKNPAAATYDGGAAARADALRAAVRQPQRRPPRLQSAARRRAAPTSACSTSASPTAAAAAIRINLAQNLGQPFGKILRIDPLGTNSANGKYGIPASNPFVSDNNADTLGEIYAYGVRNPQRFAWDPKNGNMFIADIGQNIVEEISPVTAGANLGWNDWEGSFRSSAGTR